MHLKCPEFDGDNVGPIERKKNVCRPLIELLGAYAHPEIVSVKINTETKYERDRERKQNKYTQKLISTTHTKIITNIRIDITCEQ